MTSSADNVELHHHVARFLVALARLVELDGLEGASEADAEHQSGYAVDAARKFAQLGVGPLHVTFTARVPFLRRTPLQAAPWVFQRLELLASALHDHGWSDLRIEQTIRPEDVVVLAKRIAAPPNEGQAPTIPNVLLGAESFGDLATVVTIDRNARTTTLRAGYASVVAALWDARSAVARGEMPALVRLTRAAQVTVDLADTRRMAATTPTSGRINDDSAARWADTSVLAVEMCQLVTRDRIVLRSVALAGLLLSLAPFDERGAAGQDGPPSVSRGGRIVSPDRLAARTLGLIVGVPHVSRAARLAASLAFEAQRRRYRVLGPSENATGVSIEAVALATAIRFFELRTKQSGGEVLDGVIEKLRGELVDGRDEVALRMLLSVLGVVPRGAVVELDTREIATVLSAAREGIPLEPEVEVLVDPAGRAVASPRALDLAKVPQGVERRRSLRAVLAWGVDRDALPAAGSRERAEKAEVQRTAKKRSPEPARDREQRRPALARRSTPRPKSEVPLGLEILEDFVDPGERGGGTER